MFVLNVMYNIIDYEETIPCKLPKHEYVLERSEKWWHDRF